MYRNQTVAVFRIAPPSVASAEKDDGKRMAFQDASRGLRPLISCSFLARFQCRLLHNYVLTRACGMPSRDDKLGN